MASKTIIVTTTFYSDPQGKGKIRFDLACDLADKAAEAGYQLVVVDDSPIPEVAHLLKARGALVFPQLRKGMGPSRRQAFHHAWETAREIGAEAILWTEPEKPIVPLVEQIVEPIFQTSADIVIPRRSEASWKTWPEFQIKTEQEANAVYNEVFSLDGYDPMFGPAAFSTDPEVAGFFALCRPKTEGVPDTYIQHWAPQIAKIEVCCTVDSVEVDMEYPPAQRAEEESALSEAMLAKRREQRDSLITAYRALAKHLCG